MRSVTINSDKPEALAEEINKDAAHAGVATWHSLQSLLPGAYDMITLGEPTTDWKLVQHLAKSTATVCLERPTLKQVSYLTIVSKWTDLSPAFRFCDTYGHLGLRVILDREEVPDEPLKWTHLRLSAPFLSRLAKIHRVHEFTLRQAYDTYYQHHAKSSNATSWYGPPNYEYWMKMNVRNQMAAAVYKGVLQSLGGGSYAFKLWVLNHLENEIVDHMASQRGGGNYA